MGYWLCKVCNNANDNKPVFGKPKSGCTHCGAEYGVVNRQMELAPAPVPPPGMQAGQEQPGTVLIEDVILAIYEDVRAIRQSIEIEQPPEEAGEPEPVPTQEELMAAWAREQEAKKATKAPPKVAAPVTQVKAKPGPKPKLAKTSDTVK